MPICSLSSPPQSTPFAVLFYTMRQISDTKRRPLVTEFTYTARPLACQLASPLESGNFSYRGVWHAARDICQGQIKPAHLTPPAGMPKLKICSVFYTATPIMVAKGTGAQEAPNALYPEDS